MINFTNNKQRQFVVKNSFNNRIKVCIFLICSLLISLGSLAQTLVSENFEGATFPPTGWAIVNAGTGNSWVRSTATSSPVQFPGSIAYMQYPFSSTAPANAWAFSPGITLTVGTQYLVQFVEASSGFAENLKVTIGAGQSVAAQTTTLLSFTDASSGTYTTKSQTFTVAASGTYNIGLNCFSAADQFNFAVDNIIVRVSAVANAAPVTFNSTSITQTGMTIGWTDASTNETGFRVYRSTDNINFIQVGSDISSTSSATTGNAYTSIQSGLTPGINYFYRVSAFTDGESSFLTGSAATTVANTYYYVGAATGDIATAGNWNTIANGSGSVRSTPATTDILIIDGALTTAGSPVTLNLAAATSIGGLQITSNTAVNLQSTTTATRILTITGSVGNELDVAAGSSLILNNTTQAAQVVFATGIGMTGGIAGTLSFAGSTANTITTTGGTGTLVTVQSSGIVNMGATSISLIGSTGTLSFANGSTLNASGSTTAPAIPLATWGTTSNIIVTAVTTFTAPVNNEQSFGNITINCPAGTGSNALFAGTTGGVIKGDLNIVATGAGRVRLLAAGTLVINGNMNVTGGNFDLMNSAGTLTVLGNLNVSNAAKGNFANAAGTINIGGNVVLSNTATITIGNAATTNTTNITGSLILNSTGTSVFALTSSTALALNINGNLSISAGTFGLSTGSGTGTIKLKGNLIQTGGTIGSTGAAVLVEFNGTSAQNVSFTSALTGIVNIRLNNPAGINLTGTLAINSGASYTVSSGTTTGSGIITYEATTGKLVYNSINTTQVANSLEFPAINGPASLTINNTNAAPDNSVSIPFSRTLPASGVLTLTSGILDNSSFLLTLQNSIVGAISGGSSASYIKGTVARTLPPGLGSGSTYIFPVGKSAYKPFELVNATTGGGTVSIKAEVFDANSGGTPGILIGSVNTNRYWAVSITGGAPNFINSFIRLNDVPVTADAVAASNAVAGVYDIVGGTGTTPLASSILTVAPAVTSIPGFYVMANKAAATLSNLAINPAGNQCTNVARTVTVTAIPGGAAVTTVTLNYQVNAGTTQVVSMTNIGGNNWSGILPVVTPSNGTVTWNVKAMDANGLIKTQAGVSYTDEPLTGITATATSNVSTVCAGSPVTLTGNLNKNITATVGAGASTTTTGTGIGNAAQISPFFHYYGSVKEQYLVLASELQAAGLSAGKIKSLALNVVTVDAIPLQDLSFSIANTNLTAQPATLISSGFTNVYSGTVTPVAGLNTFLFNVADFVWNGTSNIIIQSCWGNNNGGDGTTGYTVKYDATSYVSAAYYRTDNQNGATSCASTSGTQSNTFSGRPQFVFTENAAPAITGYSWSDGTNVVGTTNPLTVTPTVNTTYTVTISTLGCTKTAGTTVNVIMLPQAPGANNSVQCGTAVPAAFVTTGGGGGGFTWYDAPTGGNVLQVGGANYLSVISNTTHFWVSESNGTCESIRAEVVATVTQPDAIQASVNNANPCSNTTIILSAAKTGSANGNTYAYSWTASPQAGSGLPNSPTSANPISIIPTTPGNYIYTVTAVDGGCTTTSAAAVTVKISPSNVVASSSVTPCVGGTTILTSSATSGLSTLINYAEGFEIYPPSNWTLINAGTGNTWIASSTLTTPTPHTGANALAYLYNSTQAANAWAITPGQNLVAGTTYTLSFWYNTSSSGGLYPENLKVTVGTSATVAAQTNVLWNNNAGASLVNETYLQALPTFTPAVSGTYYFGFNCYSAANQDVLFVDDINLTGGSNPASTYNWVSNPAGFTSSVQNPPLPVTVSTATSYTVTVTNSAACSASGSVTVTPYPLPPAPSGNNGTDQCGTALTDATVSSNSGAANPVFKWYLVPTGGTAVQTGTSTTYLTPIGVSTTFYVSEISSEGCEGPRQQLSTTVSDPDPITVNASPLIVCLGGSTAISANYTASFNSFQTFTLTAFPAAGSGITNSVNLTLNENNDGTEPFTVTPTVLGNYVYTITAIDPDKGCTAVSTVTVSVNALPTIASATATASVVCAGAGVVLNATTQVVASGTVQVGTGTNTLAASTAIGAFYGSYYGNGHAQILIKGSELTSLGFVAGNLTGLSIDISALSGGNVVTLNDFTIKLGTVSTATTAITTFQSPTFTTVVGPVNYTPAVGANTHTFTTPFAWDGTSNIIVDYCFASGLSGTTGSHKNTYTVTSFNSFVNYQVDGVVTGVCNNTTVSNFSTNRPNIKFAGQVAATGAGAYSWNWNPGNLSGSTVTVNPTVTTTYTATASFNGCSANSSPVTVTVNRLPLAPSVTASTQCGLGTPGVTASGGSAGQYRWYLVSAGGVAIAGETNANLSNSVIISATTIYYVAINNGTCESQRTAVTATVTQPDHVQATALNANVCLTNTVQLTVTNTASVPTNTYSYTWSASQVAGSGIPSTFTGNSISITPTTAGTYTYTVTAVDANLGCTITSTINVIVNSNPVITGVSATPAIICANGSSSLSATTNTITPGAAASIGNGTTLTTASGTDPTAFNNRYAQYWSQTVYTATELHAAGLQAGNITGITYNISTLGDGATNQNYSILIGSTTSSTLTSFTTSGLTTVFGPASYTHAVGLNTLAFATPYSWDGVSNIIIDQRHDGANLSDNARTYFTATTGNTTISAITSTGSSTTSLQTLVQSAAVTGSLSVKRINIILNGQVTGTGPGSLNWVWNPGAIAGSIVTVNPANTTSYTVTATNPSTGCSSVSAPVTVTVTPVAATATATPSTPVCAGTSVTLNALATGGGPFTYSWNNGTGIVGTDVSITQVPTATTTYVLTVTDNCGNTATSSVIVTVNPLPTASIAETGPFTICSPATQLLTAVTNAVSPTYQWLLNAVNISGATNASYVVNSSGSYTVKVTSGTTACVSLPSNTVIVTINGLPSTVIVTPSTSTICKDAIVTLTGSVSTITATSGAGTSTSVGNATGSNLGPNPFQIYYGGTKQQMLYRAAELTALGMSSGSVISAVKFNLPTADNTLALVSFRIKMKNTPTSTISTWESGTTIVRAAGNYTPVVGINNIPLTTSFTWDGTSNLVIEVNYSNNNTGTSGSVYNTAKYSATSYASTIFYRSDSETPATINSYTGAVSFTYNSRNDISFDFSNPGTIKWSPIAGLYTNAAATTAYTGSVATTLYASPISTTTYTATATSAAGCTNSSTATVTVNPRPTGVLTGGATYCTGQGSTATVLSIAVTGAGPWTGTLSGGTTFSGSTSPITVSVTPVATTTYTIATLNGSACSAIGADLTGSATITVNPTPATPTVTAGGATTFCSGGSVILTSSSATGNQWNLNGSAVPGATNQTLTVTASGNYSVTVTNGSNCSATSTISTITVNPTPATPTVTAGGPTTFCSGGSVILTSSSATGNQWNLNGSAVPGATNQTLTVTASGNYSVTVTNESNCSATSTITTITVNPTPATPTVTAGGPTTFCSGGSVILTSSSATGNQWNLNGSAVPGATNQTLTVTSTGNYSVTVTNESNCSATSTISTITVNPTPATPTVTAGGATTFCSGGSVILTSSAATGNQWNLNGSAVPGATNQTLTVAASGNYSVTVTNESNCSATSTITAITVNPTPATPTVTAGGATTFCSGGSVILTSSSATGNQWNLNGSAVPGATNQTLTVTASGNYSVTVTNESNCSATSTITAITVNPTPATPTVTAGGATTFCSGGSVILTSSAATGNQWNLNGSAVPGATNQTLTVTASGNYSVTVTNGSNCSATSTITAVTVNPAAANPTATVTQPTCAVATGTITVTAPLGAGTTYSLDNGPFQSSVTFSGVAAGTHILSVQTSSGCFSPANTTVTVDAQPITPIAPTVTGTVNVCPYLGTSEQITYTATAAGATTYTWTLPPNVNLISGGTGTDHVTVTFNTGFSTQPNKQIRVTAGSTCGTSAMTIYYLLTQFPVTPNPISGPTNVCALIGTATVVSYTTNRSSGAISYAWSVPSNTTVTHPNGSGINDTTINVVFNTGFTGGAITVTAVNGCGTSGTRTTTIVNTPASVPGLISGPTNVCANIAPTGTAATYSVTAVAFATSYTWTTPANTTVTHPNGSGASDYTITVLYPAGFTSGTITVTATNGCGTSAARSLTVTKLNPATPGNIDVIQTHFCGENGGRVFTYSVATMPANATSVQWTVPTAGGALLVSGQGTTSITVSYPDSAITGTVTAQAVNNCGVSSTKTAGVRLPACPPPAFAGNNNPANSSGQTKNTTATANSQSLEVKIFPNPTVSDFKLEVLTSAKAQIHVRILDGTGRLYKSFTVQPYEVIALGAELKTGAYLVEVRQGETVKTTKVIKF